MCGEENVAGVRKGIDRFVYSAGIILLLTGIAKLISACGTARVLRLPVPFFDISFRWFFILAGLLEVAIALICVTKVKRSVQVGLVAWLSGNFLAYRIGLMIIGFEKPCPCLGSLVAALHISAEAAELAMRIIVLYLLVGSWLAFLWMVVRKDSHVAGTRTTAWDETPSA